MLEKLNNRHKEEIDQMKEYFESKIKVANEIVDNHNRDVELLQSKLDSMTKEKDTYKDKADRLEARMWITQSLILALVHFTNANILELIENIRRHEEEVAIRLQFEGRLNNIHSLNRDTEAKYERAINEIDNLSQHNKHQANLMLQLSNEHNK